MRTLGKPLQTASLRSSGVALQWCRRRCRSQLLYFRYIRSAACTVAMANTPVSEAPNELSMKIDTSDPTETLKIMKTVDAQMFQGFEDYPSLTEEGIVQTIQGMSVAASRCITEPDSCCVVSGAGTSGRFAFMICHTFNRLLSELDPPRPPVFIPLIAGGSNALCESLELVEDDPEVSRNDLIEATKGKKAIFYIGVTCGLSAPYVAGQVDYLLNLQEGAAGAGTSGGAGGVAVLGFNLLEQARKIPIAGLDGRTFADVSTDLINRRDAMATSAKGDEQRYFWLTPIVGPECVTGSTRMKSGSATKLLLEVIFARAVWLAVTDGGQGCAEGAGAVPAMLGCYQRSVEAVYDSASADLAIALDTAGQGIANTRQSSPDAAADAPSTPGRMFYLSDDNVALMAVIDASEQLPTFGAAMEDVQGFAVRGWDGMHAPIPTPRLRTKVSDFQSDVLPSLQSNDTVVILLAADTFAADSAAKLAEMAVLIKAVPSVALVCVSLERPAETQFVCSVPLAVARDEATTAAVSASAAQIKDCADVTACIQLPAVDLISGCGFTAELASKLCLNVISTGAQIRKGTLFENVMINVGVRNSKLFYRAQAILQRLGNKGLTDAQAEDILLRAIYQVDVVGEDITNQTVFDHVTVASRATRVVPCAILLASGACSTVAEAVQMLSQEPVIRKCIASRH